MSLILLFWCERITVSWTEGDFPSSFSSSSSLEGWATTAARKTITAKTFPVAHTPAHTQKAHLCSVCLAKGRGREVHLHNAVSRMAVNHDCSLRAAAKNTSSEGLACMAMLHSAAPPRPGLILRSNSRKAATLCCYVVCSDAWKGKNEHFSSGLAAKWAW